MRSRAAGSPAVQELVGMAHHHAMPDPGHQPAAAHGSEGRFSHTPGC